MMRRTALRPVSAGESRATRSGRYIDLTSGIDESRRSVRPVSRRRHRRCPRPGLVPGRAAVGRPASGADSRTPRRTTGHVTWHQFADRPQRRKPPRFWRGTTSRGPQEDLDVRDQQVIEQIACHEFPQGRPHPDLKILGTGACSPSQPVRSRRTMVGMTVSSSDLGGSHSSASRMPCASGSLSRPRRSALRRYVRSRSRARPPSRTSFQQVRCSLLATAAPHAPRRSARSNRPARRDRSRQTSLDLSG